MIAETLPPDHRIGANHPPEPIADPIDALTVHASDLRIEIGNWADGTKIENAAQAAVVDQLLDDVKAAIDAAEKARDGEIKPLSDQVTALREKYYPLVGETKKVTGSLILMKRALLEVKTDWGRRENARIASEAAEARRIANAAAQAAAEAARKAQAAEGEGRGLSRVHPAPPVLHLRKGRAVASGSRPGRISRGRLARDWDAGEAGR